MIDAWSPESTTTVSPGPSSVPSAVRFACAPVEQTSASSVPIHSAISRSSSRCSEIVPLSSREPVRPVPNVCSASARALDDALVAGQAEVVVRAEHDPLGALHLDDRAGRALRACGSTAAGRPRARRAAARRARGRGPWRRRLVSWRPCSVGAVNVEVRAVRTRRDRREFIELPFRLHATSEQWIPPIRLERKLFHSRRLNAYFKHAEAQEFVARRGKRVVGRISAQVDEAYDAQHGPGTGMFGFLELEDDAEVATRAARRRARLARRARAHAHDRADGLHDERRVRRAHRGLRARADDQAAVAPAVLPAAPGGGRPARRRSTSTCGSSTSPTARRSCRSSSSSPSRRVAKHGIKLRHLRRRDLSKDIKGVFGEVYNTAWKRNWGFVPYSRLGPHAVRRRSCSSSSTATGSWSPRRTARRSASRSRCPTSTSC